MKEESIIQKLKQIIRLIEDPASTLGEKSTGKLMLEALMNKHQIKIDDLIDVKKTIQKFYFSNKYEKKLILQIAYKILGPLKDVDLYWYGKNVFIKVSKIEEIDIRWLYKIYRSSFRKKIDDYFEAFIHANQIFSLANDTNEKSYSEEEIQRLYKILQMANGIDPDPIIPASRHLNYGVK